MADPTPEWALTPILPIMPNRVAYRRPLNPTTAHTGMEKEMTEQRFSTTESERDDMWHVLDLDNLDTVAVHLPRKEFAEQFATALNRCTPLDASQVEAVRAIYSDRMSAFASTVIRRLDDLDGADQLTEEILGMLVPQSASFTHQLATIAEDAE